MPPRKKPITDRFALNKCATGIHGLDEITMGGIPKGRPTYHGGRRLREAADQRCPGSPHAEDR